MNIKKISLFLLTGLTSLNLLAEGYQLNTNSARQIGMGHTGAALRLGSENMVFNPAGLSFMQGKADISLGMTAIKSKVKFTNGSYVAKTDNPLGTPFFGYAGFKLSKKIFAGISITNPAGNSLVWPENWVGTHHVQDISLKAFSIQPTISFKINEHWSIGAGIMANFGNFEMNKGILPIGALSPYLQNQEFPQQYKEIISSTIGISPINATLKGDAGLKYGFNIGAMFTPNEKWTFGISYRSKVMMSLKKGEASISYGSPELQTLFTALASLTPPNPSIIGAMSLDGMSFSAKLPIPSNFNLGTTFSPNKKWLFTAELQYVGWKAYDQLVMEFENPQLSTTQQKNFSNSMIYRLGSEYKPTDKLTLRAGLIYDKTPLDKMFYSPETPGANKPSFTAGFTYTPSEKIAFDLGFQYLNGIEITGSTPQATLPPFIGNYKSTALLASFGLRFNF